MKCSVIYGTFVKKRFDDNAISFLTFMSYANAMVWHEPWYDINTSTFYTDLPTLRPPSRLCFCVIGYGLHIQLGIILFYKRSC